MYHGEGRNSAAVYGSFSNTRPGLTTTTGSAGSEDQEEQSKGHQRNDSEVGESCPKRPLLNNHDSSSDEESGVGKSFSYTRQRSRAHHRPNVANSVNNTASDQVQIDIPVDPGSDDGGHVDCDDEDSIPSEPLKTLISAIFMSFGWIVTTVSLALTHERVPDVDPLPDVILDNFSYQAWGLDASEICIMVMVWTALLIVLFHRHRFIVFRRIFFLLGLHYTYRAITMYVTVLPKPNPEYVCAEKLNHTTAAEIVKHVLTILSGLGLSINGKHVYCGDYIYSGHTLTLITAYLVIRDYSPSKWFLLHWMAMLTSAAGIVLLLLARGHYTIDVLIAYVITTRLWWAYHTLANNDSLKGELQNPHNHLSKTWWWLIFRYFEQRVPSNLPLKFGWPIPKRLKKWSPIAVFFRRKSQRLNDSQIDEHEETSRR